MIWLRRSRKTHPCAYSTWRQTAWTLTGWPTLQRLSRRTITVPLSNSDSTTRRPWGITLAGLWSRPLRSLWSTTSASSSSASPATTRIGASRSTGPSSGTTTWRGGGGRGRRVRSRRGRSPRRTSPSRACCSPHHRRRLSGRSSTLRTSAPPSPVPSWRTTSVCQRRSSSRVLPGAAASPSLTQPSQQWSKTSAEGWLALP
mmetsp:Transcript_148349/g.413261  ORF Transcript_148349/g.413261 Transcript_148349/m.413261 type:complete len:201 (+) Transcript_148349:2725-3327(+)